MSGRDLHCRPARKRAELELFDGILFNSAKVSSKAFIIPQHQISRCPNFVQQLDSPVEA
jgi:hypothetical protein